MRHLVSDLYKDSGQTMRPEIGPKLSRRVVGWCPRSQARGGGFLGFIISQAALSAGRLCRRKFPQTSSRPPPNECQWGAEEGFCNGGTHVVGGGGKAGKTSEAPGKG